MAIIIPNPQLNPQLTRQLKTLQSAIFTFGYPQLPQFARANVSAQNLPAQNLPAPSSCFALKGTYDIGGNPATVKIACLRCN